MLAVATLDSVIVVVYLLAVVGLGCWLARSSGNPQGFMAASGRLPGWAVGLSIFGTFVSSISFLANPGKSFGQDWNAFTFGLSLPLAAWIASKYFVPFYRSSGEISAYHHLEHRFGAWARYYSVACYLLTQIARTGSILYLVALAVSPLVDLPVEPIIVAVGVLVTLYTLIGGIEAVVWTDVIQSLVLLVGLLLTLGVLWFGMPTDLAGVKELTWDAGKFGLGSMRWDVSMKTFWVVLLYGLVINLQNFGIDQNYVQRYATARSSEAASRSLWTGTLLFVPTSALLFLVGTLLFAYYQLQPERLPEGIKSDAVYPHFIAHELPVGVTGVLIAAIVAAAMSSVDSSLNSAASITLQDGYRRLLGRDPSDRQAMRVLWGATIFYGVVGTIAALAMTKVESVLDAWWKLAGIFGGGMLGLFLIGRIMPRVGSWHAACGVTCGVLAIVWMTFSNDAWWPTSIIPYRNPMDDFMTIVVGTVVVMGVSWMVALVTGRSAPRPEG